MFDLSARVIVVPITFGEGKGLVVEQKKKKIKGFKLFLWSENPYWGLIDKF
ncbi:protein of unknown function [Limnospira indica PCC 8005]|uniref:Uncharacterized protein n=1 Tax=Limnospira indica PCC 8005 TaxID=376219 RepID=A0A9P1KJK9_9CYAN|nr:protein of unknown function [Limnospira indica PCC 8005]